MQNIFKFIILLVLFFQSISVFAQNYAAELTYQETNITIKNGKLYKNSIYQITIYNQGGEQFNKVSIAYSKLNRVSKIEAYIKDKQGKIIRKLKKSEIKTRSAIAGFSFYEDDFVKEFTLKHNQYPYSIVYSYQEVQDEFLYIEYYLPIISTQIPTLQAILTLETPQEYKIAFDSLLTSDFEKVSLDGKTNYRWQMSYKTIVQSEKHAPVINHFLPHVIVVPQNFKFDKKGSFEDWVHYGNWQYELNQELSDLPPSEKAKIRTLIKGVESEKEKIRILYHYLQDNTRYINISIETGGMKPYPASYVAQNKYGDCKALSNYFKSALEFIDVESFYTTVYAGDAIKKINQKFPSQQFNHVILSVPIQNDTLWLDCTSDAAFNYLGTFTQNRNVLLVNENKSHFVRTPSLSKQDVLETRSVKFISTPENTLTADFENVYRGKKYESLFYASQAVNANKKAQIIRNYYVEEGFELDKFSLANLDRDSTFISLSYSATAKNFYKKYGNETLMPLLSFSIPDFEKPSDRKLPVQLDYPIYKRDTLEYSWLNGYELSNLLKNQTIVSKFGEYKIGFEHEFNRIKVIKSFLLNSGFYSKEEYEEFYNFIKKVKQVESNFYIILNKQK